MKIKTQDSPQILQLRAELEMLGRIEWWLVQQEKSIRAQLDALIEAQEERSA